MKQLLGGVAMVAVLAVTAPVWAQQNPNTPPATTQPPAAAPMAQPATPNVPPVPQAQAPQAQAPMPRGQAPQTQMPEPQRPTAANEERPRHRGMRYQMRAGGRHHWRHAHAWRRHHRWSYAHRWHRDHARYAHAWRWHHRHYWDRAYSERDWSPSMAWSGDWRAPQMNAQQMAPMQGQPGYNYPYRYQYGSSAAPMMYQQSAGYGAGAPMGPGGVLWQPPGSRAPSPPGFPPPFWFW